MQHAIGVSSGTDALLAALMASGIGPGDEVVTSTFSFFATAGCVARLGARAGARRHRSRRRSTSMPTAAIAAITPRTSAIVPVHLFGQSADLMPIINAGDPARHSRHRGRGAGDRRDVPRITPSGGLGAIGCFSFFPSKNLGAFGDGGLVTTNDRRARRISCARCATTAWSRSTSTTSSAATSGSTRCRPRCCA